VSYVTFYFFLFNNKVISDTHVHMCLVLMSVCTDILIVWTWFVETGVKAISDKPILIFTVMNMYILMFFPQMN
jgi:hypothetical protein